MNAAVRLSPDAEVLREAHQRLVEVTEIDGGDFMFVVAEQLSGLTVDRLLRLTDYSASRSQSVWAMRG